MKSRSRSVFGGRFGERGSALVYAVVLFGLCAVILGSSVSRESSAQTLNIQTGQRRKALDLARGSVDEMLMALYENDFDVAKCPGYSAESGVSLISREDSAEGWTATVTAREQAPDLVLVEGHAIVRKVSETVRVWLEPYSLADIFSDGAIVAGGNAHAEFNPNATGAKVEGNVRVGGKWTLDEKGKQFEVENGKVVAGVPVDVPEPDQIKASVLAMVGARSWPGVITDKEHTVISTDTETGNLNLTGSSLTVEADTWLYVDGKFNGNGSIESVTVDGVMVVTGQMNFNTNKNVPISVSGTGTIICLSDKKSKITLGAGSWGGITLVCTGELDLSFANAPEPKPGGNSLLVYGGTLGVRFLSEHPIELNPCRFMSPGDMELNFENKAKLVGLHAGEIDPDPGGQVIVIGYRIVQWKEGK